MGQHKKSKSWSALISFPAMLTPSSSSGTRQSSQPTTSTTNSSNIPQHLAGNQHTPQLSRIPPPPSAISMKKSSSQQQYPSNAYGINSGNDSDKVKKDNNDDTINSNNTDNNDGSDGLASDIALHSLPLFYLFSSDALADENAKEDTIIPFMEPPSLALDQATLIAGVLESLVRVVDDIPTGITDDDDSSGNVTNDTEHEEQDTSSDDGEINNNEQQLLLDDTTTFDMDHHSGKRRNRHHPTTVWSSNGDNDDGNDITFDSDSSSSSSSSSSENLRPSTSSSSSTKRSPFTIPPYTDHPHHQHCLSTPASTTTTQHDYPRPSTSTLSTFSSSTSAYTLRNSDHHLQQQQHRHYHSNLQVCPFTIIGLGSFKVALWPSVLNSFSGNQDLNLVVLVSPTYPDHDIIDIMYKMKKSLNHAFSSVVHANINAQLIGQHLTPLVKTGFTVE